MRKDIKYKGKVEKRQRAVGTQTNTNLGNCQFQNTVYQDQFGVFFSRGDFYLSCVRLSQSFSVFLEYEHGEEIKH